jgi:hypothetical protein
MQRFESNDDKQERDLIYRSGINNQCQHRQQQPIHAVVGGESLLLKCVREDFTLKVLWVLLLLLSMSIRIALGLG